MVFQMYVSFLVLCADDGTEPLTWAMTELDLQSQKQLQQDEELAQRLQEEEQAHIVSVLYL